MCRDEAFGAAALLDRQSFEQALDDLLASRTRHQHHALLYLKLERPHNGKKVDGEEMDFGSLAEVSMQQVIRLCGAGMSQKGILARLREGQFAILLRRNTPEQALQTARLLRTTVQNSVFQWQGVIFKLTVHIGLVIFNHRGDKAELLEAADQACVIAGQSGRNSIHTIQVD